MSDFLAELRACVGADHVLTEAQDTASYFHEYGGRLQSKGLAVVRPATTQQVSDVVKICARYDVTIVPQGGNTGLVGGSVPYHMRAICLSLTRMHAVRDIDPENYSITVEAGCILQEVQERAAAVERFFPLALGAQGSCRIGGNIATNAGGILTMRYGNMRDLVLGLEVVLPNGDIWNGMNSLRKDNAGYNLKHIFIGSEGTLGIVTAAVLKLYPDPGARVTCFMAVHDICDVVTLFATMRARFGGHILAYELLSDEVMRCILQTHDTMRHPLAASAPWYVLMDITGHDAVDVENALGDALEGGLIHDAVLAQNDTQRRAFWAIRECASDAAQASEGGSIKHDIAVPIASIPDFIEQADKAIQDVLPDVVVALFGHAGDGNLHYDLIKAPDMDVKVFCDAWHDLNHAVHDVVARFNGSFAAEHGVGTFKASELMERKDAVELSIMRAVKDAFDPDGRMNMGVVWPHMAVLDE